MTESLVESSVRLALTEPDLRGSEIDRLKRCVSDNWVSSAGPDVGAFEQRIARLAGRRHGVATVNGTAALYLALRLLGVAPGDRVIVPDWTFAATANAVLMAGALPVFVDVSPETWGLCPDRLAAALAQQSVRAVMVVHALGHPADMAPILAVAGRHGIPVVEDAAGALGAGYRGRPVGSLATSAIFSFNGNKIVTTGGGGALVTDDEAAAARGRALAAQARSGTAYRYEEWGFNLRLPNLNAALGLAQLDRLDEMIAAKRAIARRYDQALAGRRDLQAMPRRSWAEPNGWLYSVRCRDRATAADLIAHLDRHDIEARAFWEALSTQPAYAGYPAMRNPTAEALSGTVVSLPCSSGLTEQQQSRVLSALAAWQGPATAALAGAAP